MRVFSVAKLDVGTAPLHVHAMTVTPTLSTRALIDQLCEGSPEGTMTLDELLDNFSERSFGLFLLIIMLPIFIPLPLGAGGVSGLLAALIGGQFLLRFEHPWLPQWLAQRPIHRRSLMRFRDTMGRWLGWIERLTKPRNPSMLSHPLAHAFTGLQLVLLGILLSLPLPLTNYPFGLILLCYAFALIERDGRLMMIAWIFGLSEIAVMAGFSGKIAAWAATLF